MKTLMREMGFNGIATPHGFRSSFTGWATEQTHFRTATIDLALAHAVGKVEGAYRRGDLREQRRQLSKAWGDFCLGLWSLSDSDNDELRTGTTG
jgi:hypothetical protein